MQNLIKVLQRPLSLKIFILIFRSLKKWSNTTDGYDLSGNMWAPDIIYNKDMGKYCMYLSVNGQV